MNQTSIRLFIMCAAANCIANITWYLQPFLMQYLANEHSLPESRAGLLISLEIGAIAVGFAILTPYSSRSGFIKRAATIGAIAAVLAGFATLFSTSFFALAASRVVLGLSTGALIMSANSITARLPNAYRAFAVITFINIVFGTLLSTSLPWLSKLTETTSPYEASLAALLVLSIAIFLMPSIRHQPQSFHHTENDSVGQTNEREAIICLVLSLFLIALSSSISWPYYAIVGTNAGMKPDEVINAISLSIFTALLGTTLATFIGKIAYRNAAIAFGLACMSIAIWLLTNSPSATVFKFATCMQVAAIFSITPLLFRAAAELDSSGKGSSTLGSAFFLAGGLSPMLGGYLSATVGLQTVGEIIISFCVCVLVLVLVILSRAVVKREAHLACSKTSN